jgi:hypothetical protein
VWDAALESRTHWVCLNQEYLQKKYVDENLSADEVASEIGCVEYGAEAVS